MKPVLRRLLSIVFVAVATLFPLGGPSLEPFAVRAAAAEEGPSPPETKFDHGFVYLMRGLGNIWSRGIDELGEELEARGVRQLVSSHRHWKRLADEAAERYANDDSFAPIIIIGHSLGANASVLMAAKLGERGIPVRLMIALDGIARDSKTKSRVSRNVEEVLNYYNSRVFGIELIPGRGFDGKIENVDTHGVRGAFHYKIDKNPELRARIMGLVLEVLGEDSQ